LIIFEVNKPKMLINKIFPSNLRYLALYSFCMALLAFTLKWMQWKFFITDNSVEIYVGLIAVLFTALGIWISHQLTGKKVKVVVMEKETPATPFELNQQELVKLNLTSREYEVLQLMAQGRSNQEIAESLFLSVSTVKTHASNLFIKMEVKRRTQAIEKAKRLGITP
jgi:NarL family two-component system response regulator LiaR